MMELNIKEFADKVKELDDNRNRQREEGLQYLYDTIYAVLARDESITLSDIDFSRFTADEYDEFCRELTGNAKNIDRLFSVFDKSLPCSISAGTMFF